MFHSCYTADQGDKFLPALLLRSELFPAEKRQAVVSAPTLLRFFHPASFDPAFLLQTMEQRVERRDVKLERAAGADLDELRDVVAVARLILEQRHHQQLSASLLPFLIGLV